ncbi:MAG: protein kinase domain-containing protein, partial [Planctomycetota bacterium]
MQDSHHRDSLPEDESLPDAVFDKVLQRAFEDPEQASGSEDENPSVLDLLRRHSKQDLTLHLPDPQQDREPVLKLSPQSPRLGSRRYQLLGELAKGGMSMIYRGRDLDLGRDVAIKTLRDRSKQDPRMLARFVEEAQIGGQLQHPGIVPVYEIGLQPDYSPFFAMKLVQGETLAALLGKRSSFHSERRRFLGI